MKAGLFFDRRRVAITWIPAAAFRGGDPFAWSLVGKHGEWHVRAGIAGVTLLLAARYYRL